MREWFGLLHACRRWVAVNWKKTQFTILHINNYIYVQAEKKLWEILLNDDEYIKIIKHNIHRITLIYYSYLLTLTLYAMLSCLLIDITNWANISLTCLYHPRERERERERERHTHSTGISVYYQTNSTFISY